MKDYSFGNYICALRTGLGLSQFQLGTLVGVTDKAVSKWENGDAKPRISTCYRLAAVLGVTIDELLSCKQEKSSVPARKELNSMNKKLWNEAYERLSIYGENPPVICRSRLAAEKEALSETDTIQCFAVLGEIEAKAEKNHSVTIPFDVAAASFTAWLLGATKANPLPAHYRCPKCGRTEFVPDVADGFDLPPKTCQCGADYLRDGHNIPFAEYAQKIRHKNFVTLRVTPKMRPAVEEIIREGYRGRAEILPVKMCLENGRVTSIDHYVVMKQNRAWPTLAEDGTWHVDSGEFWCWCEDETVFSVVTARLPYQIERLWEMTGIPKPDPIALISEELLNHLYQRKREQEYVRNLTDGYCNGQKPGFGLMVKIDGCCYSCGIWDTYWENCGEQERCLNAVELICSGRADFLGIPASREDVWEDVSRALIQKGIRDNGLAMEIMENARFGRYQSGGMSKSEEAVMRELGLPEWYPDFLKKVLYMSSKTSWVPVLLHEMIVEWYIQQAPEAWELLQQEEAEARAAEEAEYEEEDEETE